MLGEGQVRREQEEGASSKDRWEGGGESRAHRLQRAGEMQKVVPTRGVYKK